MINNTYKQLINEAIKAREMAYAPYSDFRVGAALLSKSGKIYSGCNIENSAYSPTNCAERTAFFKAISEGEREFTHIAIVAGKDKLVITSPCGVCRQVMSEFVDKDFLIIMATSEEDYEVMIMEEIFPRGFNLNNQ